MKRFTFRLAPLLELRMQHEEQVKLLLAEKNRQIVEERNKLNLIYDQLKFLQSSEKDRRPEGTQVVLMRYSVAYRHKLKADILRTGRTIDELSGLAAVIQQDLIKATKARRALELLRDKQLTAWKKAYRREEQNFIDDIAQKKYPSTRK